MLPVGCLYFSFQGAVKKIPGEQPIMIEGSDNKIVNKIV